MHTGSALRICSLLLVVLLIAAEVTSAAPYSDYDRNSKSSGVTSDLRQYQFRNMTRQDLRDLYELLLRNEAPSHQMERKGGRSPSLRLRFGRRADPLWRADGPDSQAAN